MQILGGRKPVNAPQLQASPSRKPLMVATALGLIAAFLTWNYIQRAGSSAHNTALVPVIVAANDISVRTTITPEMLAVKQVPVDARHPKALTAPEQVAGKVTNLPIAAGEQVLSTKFFARKEDSGLAYRVAPGKRAVSVNVSEVITAGGLINPGDFVDIIGLFSAASGANGTSGTGGATAGQDFTATVLQNIEVLAVAQSLQGVSAPQGSGLAANVVPGSRPDTGRQEAVARPDARTFTLAVTPEEAQKLILADEKGKIRLALRAMEDHDSAQVVPTGMSAVRP